MAIKQKREAHFKMISYAPLWQTMQQKSATTYTLQVKGQISSSTIRRLKTNESVSTNTLDALCNILDCDLPDIIAYVRKEKRETLASLNVGFIET